MEFRGRALALCTLCTLASIPALVLPANAQPPAATFGEQHTLVMLVNFQDNTAEPYTAAFARDLVFGTVSSFYYENSYHQAWLGGDVVGWLTIPQSSTACDMTALSALAKQAATDTGVDVGAYSRYVYAFPQNACGWWGWAVSGLPTQMYINGTLNLYVFDHEMGHNFGLKHSRSLHCEGSPIGSPCDSAELGDGFDVMGSGTGHFNAYQKERLGWLGYGNSPPVTTVSSSGTYDIEPLETATAGPKAVKILRSFDPATGERIWYYVELRRALGFDSHLAGNANVLNGVLVHTASDRYDYKIDLRDMTADTATLRDPALVVGQTFTDSAAGVTITPIAANDAGAVVAVTLGAGACTPRDPTTTLSPAQPAPVMAGTTVQYTLSVSNNDSVACGPTSFSLETWVPSGWTATTASPSLLLEPGRGASTTVTVRTPLSTPPGTYAWSAIAADGARSASASANLVIAAPLSLQVSTVSPSYSRGATVLVQATVKAGTTAVAGAVVSFRIVPPKGKATTASAKTDGSGVAVFQFRLSKAAATGVYQVAATVATAGQTGAASTTFVVQ